ncbi:hypothetical protein [Chryseobacterium rhizosphaerae]|uniref:hypothetical protein n=1 Tax=Chryseobacterium rhizosphaerae TaxID=395937 RepID=UPI0023595447|nr:hypothetical protein [Chryseobacterium rhizosphaerae]MDC8100615.1 hypothetical protein [Chryseobacterium rhizosphaerae]
MQNPINAIDPNGRRVYFIGGAGNDSDGWNYIGRFKSIWTALGIKDFRRVNASHGKMGDIGFVGDYRNREWKSEFGVAGPVKIGGVREDKQYQRALKGIMNDLKKNPLKEGEQLNLTGYSYGSVLQEHLAIGLADKGYGNNRKFSTSQSDTYRIAATAKINLDNRSMTMTPHITHSDWLGTEFSSATSPTNVKGSNAYNSNKQSFYVHMYGSNKAMLWGIVSPDIDTNVSFNVSNVMKGQSFDIEGTVYGDKFPSNETFITDTKGNSLFLGASGADGSPYTSLAGDNERPMSSFRFKVLLNKNDTFKGVNYKGKNYSPNQWNAQFQKLNPQDGNVQSGKAAK